MEEQKIQEILNKNYNLTKFIISFIRESSDNILYKIITETDNYVLRISKREALIVDDLMFELGVIESATKDGVSTTKIVKTRDGLLTLIIEGKFFVLFEFINGIHIENSKEVIPKIEKVYNAGKVLAKLHVAWEKIEIKHLKTRTMFTELERFFDLKDFFVENYENGLEIYNNSYSIFNELKDKKSDEIIHNDYRPHNLFFNKFDDEVCAVLDFDWSCRGNYIKDLAHSIIEWSSPDGTDGVRLNLAQAFLDGYLSVRNMKITVDELKKWMFFSCTSDAITYWVDRKGNFKKGSILESHMYNKAEKVRKGLYDDLMFTEIRPYLYLDGLKQLAADLKGNEKIHIGIRPYGFHAGNALIFTAYPRILCEEFMKIHSKSPTFTFIISINDWEQDNLDGPDYRRFTFNIYPKTSSIESLYMEDGVTLMIDYWEPIIKRCVNYSLGKFNGVNINFYRNSSLKNTESFKELLIETIKNPKKQFEIYKKYSKFEFLDSPIVYGGVICPDCTSAHGYTNYYNYKILWKCLKCGISLEKNYEDYKYWWYHKMLLVGRIKHFSFDVLLSGGDHYNENDFQIRQALFREFLPEVKMPKMFFGVTLISNKDGKRMSKSKGNTFFADIEKLYEIAKDTDSNEIILKDDMIMNLTNQEYEKYCNNL
jgi:Ser/Thr protein kinase RdoA (MazF antagonist)